MEMKQLKCPSCGAGIEMDLKGLKGRDTLYCPYCGSQFSIDDDLKYLIDASLSQTTEFWQRIERREEREHRLKMCFLIGSFVLIIFIFLFVFFITR